MFFLGISAHLFIYLLVPAFLIVCFYFRGISGHPETLTTFPEVVVCEHTIHHSTENTYVYQIKEQRPSNQTLNIPIVYPPVLLLSGYFFIVYSQPALLTKALRAPPTLN